MVVSFVYDNFDDNSIDPTRWSPAVGSSGLQSESGGRLLTPSAASATPTVMRSIRNYYDIRKGRLVVRLTKTGTANADTYTYFGIRDNNGNVLTLFGQSTTASIYVAANGAGDGTETQLETTVGVGPSWTANSYLSWTYDETNKYYVLAKSTNGTTWNNIFRYAVTGTPGPLNYKRVGWFLGCTCYGTVTNFTPSWDDATYIANEPDLYARVRYNGAMVNATPKVRVDGSWKRAIGHQRVGGIWVRGK